MTAVWFTVIGVLLCGMAVAGTYIERLPITTSLTYIVSGVLLGPIGFGILLVSPINQAHMLELAAQTAVLVSLFVSGLKLRSGLKDRRWRLPVRLATTSMIVTIAGIAVLAVFGLGLSWGAAILLGGILAPTDPVLASDVQVETATDRDRLRFALTGEAGLNDGTAFPFVLLGLGLLGHHELGTFGWRWLAVDIVWGVAVGIAIGAFLGTIMGRVVLFLRTKRHQAVGLDDLLALGLIALAYGAADLVSGYGFLAVFAAGLALRRIERVESAGVLPHNLVEGAVVDAVGETENTVATDEGTAHVYMAEAALSFTEQLERMAEVGVVLVLGSMLTRQTLALDAWWFVLALFLVIRPVAVLLTAHVRHSPPIQRRLISWFGIRGVGSVYYLMYALQHGINGALADRLIAITFTVIASSALLHGTSVTPLMRRYKQLRMRSLPSVAS